MEKISTKKIYVSTDGWRGYEQPKFAVCGANNTGSYSDSPCPENVCLAELKQAGNVLRKNGIKYRKTWCRSSNVFCIHGYLVVAESNLEKAKELVKPLESQTRLLYVV